MKSKTPPPAPPAPPQVVVYRHKTISIPQEAYARLHDLRELVSSPSTTLKESDRAFLDEKMVAGQAKYTFGMICWAAFDRWLAELEKQRGK